MAVLGVVVKPPGSKVRPRLWTVTTTGSEHGPTVADGRGSIHPSGTGASEREPNSDSARPDGSDDRKQSLDAGEKNESSAGASGGAGDPIREAPTVSQTDFAGIVQGPSPTVGTVGTVGSPATGLISGIGDPTVPDADPSDRAETDARREMELAIERDDEVAVGFAAMHLERLVGRIQAREIEAEICAAVRGRRP